MPEGEAMRLALHRRLYTELRMPGRCREPICRRTHICAGPTLRCERDFPPPPSSEAELAKAMAELRRALERRLAGFMAGGAPRRAR
jgi:hypothetical protein